MFHSYASWDIIELGMTKFWVAIIESCVTLGEFHFSRRIYNHKIAQSKTSLIYFFLIEPFRFQISIAIGIGILFSCSFFSALQTTILQPELCQGARVDQGLIRSTALGPNSHQMDGRFYVAIANFENLQK